MLASAPFAWRHMLPRPLKELAGSSISALFFGSNFWFWSKDNNYWAEPNALKPLLHTWSLSIEEQFYVLFPVALALLWRYSRKHIASIFGLAFLISLLSAHLFSVINPSASFYLLPMRGWELLAGALLARLEVDRGRTGHPLLGATMPALGLLLICGSFFFFGPGTRHPSLITLMPVGGTMLVIWFGRKGELFSDVLSSRPLVGIGLISYGLYLWHYPIFAFALIRNPDSTSVDKLLLVLLTSILSIITYFVIERPFRRGRFYTPSRFAGIAASVFAVLVLFSYSTYESDGYPERLPSIFKEDFTQVPWLVQKNKSGQYCYGIHGKRTFCHFKRPGSTRTAIVVGDSTIESIAPALTSKLLVHGFDVLSMNSSMCYFAPGFFAASDGRPINNPKEPCDEEYQRRRLVNIHDHPGATIILGGILDSYLKWGTYKSRDGRSIEEGYRSAVMNLLNDGFTVVQLAPMLRFKGNVSQSIFNYVQTNMGGDGDLGQVADRAKLMRIKSYPLKKYLEYAGSALRILRSVKHENYSLLYPHELFCDTLVDGRCISNNTDNLFFVDIDHPAKAGAEMVADLIVENIHVAATRDSRH